MLKTLTLWFTSLISSTDAAVSGEGGSGGNRPEPAVANWPMPIVRTWDGLPHGEAAQLKIDTGAARRRANWV